MLQCLLMTRQLLRCNLNLAQLTLSFVGPPGVAAGMTWTWSRWLTLDEQGNRRDKLARPAIGKVSGAHSGSEKSKSAMADGRQAGKHVSLRGTWISQVTFAHQQVFGSSVVDQLSAFEGDETWIISEDTFMPLLITRFLSPTLHCQHI